MPASIKITYTTVEGEVLAESRASVATDYLPDPLGSTAALLDATQAKTDSFAYWPYGEHRASTGTTSPVFRFAGTLGYYQDSSDRMYVRARTYQQKYGRWSTQAPTPWLLQGEHPYGYALSNPAGYLDPGGDRPQKKQMQKPSPPKQIYPPSREIPGGKGPAWSKCIGDSINRHCRGIDLPPDHLYAYVWCVIDGESRWDPNQMTLTKYGYYAYGLMQITPPTQKWICPDAKHWMTDPCENIDCGVALLCWALRQPSSQQYIKSKTCRGQFNAIYQPSYQFEWCLSNKFGIRLKPQ